MWGFFHTKDSRILFVPVAFTATFVYWVLKTLQMQLQGGKKMKINFSVAGCSLNTGGGRIVLSRIMFCQLL